MHFAFAVENFPLKSRVTESVFEIFAYAQIRILTLQDRPFRMREGCPLISKSPHFHAISVSFLLLSFVSGISSRRRVP